ncbi:MAG: deoxyribonuclease IV [Acidobacteriota bacterium]|jgi:deoxyribonuclease-4
MRFGAHVSVAGGIDRAPERAAAIGAETYQVFVKSNRQWRAGRLADATVSGFRRQHREHGLGAAFAHGCYLVNLASPHTSVRERSIRCCAVELGRCARLGLEGLVIHPGAHLGIGVEAGLNRIARALDRLPIDRCRVLLEVTAGQGTTIGGRHEEIAWLLQRFAPELLGVCLDSCHLHAAGHALDSARRVAAALELIEETIGFERIHLIHLNDSAGAAGSRLDRHRGIGDGTIGDAGFRHLLQDPRVRRLPGILETPKGEGTRLDRRNLARLRALAAGKRMPRGARRG